MMNPAPTKVWYKKKRYIIPAIILGVAVYAVAASSSSPSTATYQVPQTASVVQTLPTAAQPTQDNTLSNDNYYTNTYGNTVHSPAYSDSVPQGASAECRDGSYSFSQSRRGTCSYHGGVMTWY